MSCDKKLTLKDTLQNMSVSIKKVDVLLTEATAINEAVRVEHIGLKSTINTDGELIITKEDSSFVKAVRLEDGQLILTY
jgi:prophage tail gpP-like protein